MNVEFGQEIEKFIQNINLRYPGSETGTNYQNDLELFNRQINKAPREVSKADVTQFVQKQLAQEKSASTVNRRLATLRSFFEYLASEAEEDNWANPVVWKRHRVKEGSHLPKDLPEEVARQFWKAVEKGSERDQAIVGLMLDVGLRVGEVVNLKVGDYEAVGEGESLSSLRVKGKGNKERRVWLTAETGELVENWLKVIPQVEDKALFITRQHKGFTRRGIQERVKHYGRLAELSAEDVSCHRLRHTFARRMAEARMPLPSLSHWLGHSHLKTTERYIDGAAPDVRTDYQRAMEKLNEVKAECTDIKSGSERGQKGQASRTIPECVSQARLLEKEEIESRMGKLPSWLVEAVEAFISSKQMHWQAQYRRERGQQWLGELVRAWQWWLEVEPMGGLSDLRRVDLVAYLKYLYERELSPHTIKHFLNTLRAFLHFMEERGVVIAPGLYRVSSPQNIEWSPRALPENEYQQLEQAVLAQTATMSEEAGVLHRCWFFILADGGLRIGELQTLTISDWSNETHTLRVRYGKGKRERLIPLSERVGQVIEAHLNSRSPNSLAPNQPLVAYEGKAIKPTYVRSKLRAIAKEAKLDGITPHRLRHTYATRLLNTGHMPITTLQKLMGHTHIDTTMRYVKLYDKTIRTDYETATAVLQRRAKNNPDWEIWGKTIETVFDKQQAVEKEGSLNAPLFEAYF